MPSPSIDPNRPTLTLRQCLELAGGFPFIAKAVRDAAVEPSIPTGEAHTFDGEENGKFYCTTRRSRVDPDFARWALTNITSF